MAREIVITESEILSALADARKVRVPDPPGAFVASELAKKNRVSKSVIWAQVAALKAKGLIESLQVHREGSDGRQMMVQAYRILRAPKARR